MRALGRHTQWQYALFVPHGWDARARILMEEFQFECHTVLESAHGIWDGEKEKLKIFVFDVDFAQDERVLALAAQLATDTQQESIRVTCKKIAAWNVPAGGIEGLVFTRNT